MGKGKVYLQTLAGLAITFAGLYVTFGYITSIVDGGNIWLLLVSLPLVGLGAFILLRAGRSEATVVKKNIYEPGIIDGKLPDDKKRQNTLEKNTALTEEYGKTNEARARLKLLQASADAQKN